MEENNQKKYSAIIHLLDQANNSNDNTKFYEIVDQIVASGKECIDVTLSSYSFLPSRSKLLIALQEKGVNINSLTIPEDVLEETYEVLLRHPTNPINIKTVLKQLMPKYAFRQEKYQAQSQLVKLALDYGVDITQIDGLYINLKFLYRNQDILLNHPTNPIDRKKFYKKALCEVVIDEEGYQAQSHFIKLALDYGVDITQISGVYLTLEIFWRNQDILLNHPTNPIDPKKFFEKAFSLYAYNEESYKAQSQLVKLAIDYGIDITKINSLNLTVEFLYHNKEFLINHPTNPMSKEVFFGYALSGEKSNESEHLRNELLKEAINTGVKLSNIKGLYLNLDLIMENYDLLLNHPTNSLNHELFIKLVLAQDTDNPEYLNKQLEFLKQALDSGFDFNKILRIHFNILAKGKDLLLNHPTNPLSPNKYLEYLLSADSDHKDFNEKLQFEIAKEVIELGADVNQEFKRNGMVSLLSLTVSSSKIANLLKSYGAECEIASRNYEKYLEEHPKAKSFLNDQSEYYIKTDEKFKGPMEYPNKIPFLIHHVWLTHPSSPREISENDIENVLLTKENFGGNLSKWKHIIWTNNKNLIPKSVEILEENGIEVREISEYRDQFILYDTVNALSENKLWGMASDALRYEIVANFGGVYADLNFHFLRDFESEMYKYDFFAQSFTNNFFAARPNHPILNSLVQTMIFHFNNEPEYLTNFSEKHAFDKTILFSLLPFGVSIIENYNNDHNTDMVLGLLDKIDNTCSVYSKTENELNYGYAKNQNETCPSYWELSSKCFIRSSSEHEKSAIGKDGYKNTHVTWIEEDHTSDAEYDSYLIGLATQDEYLV